MGHRSCVVRHHPTTLPGALSRTHALRSARLERADKKRASFPSSRSPTTFVIIFEGRRPDRGGSIDAALQSIVHLLLLPRDLVVTFFQSILILILHEFDELYDCVHERSTARPIDRSLQSIVTASVFEARSQKSINKFAESSVRDQARTTGIPNKYRTCKSISKFEARSKVLERPGESSTNAPVATDIERSFGSILILLNIIELPVESSIQSIKSIQRKNSKINWLERITDFKKRFPIIVLTYRLSNERTITHVKNVSIFLSKLINYFFQLAIFLEVIDFYETHFSFSLSRKSLIHVVAPFRAAVMMSGRRTSFR